MFTEAERGGDDTEADSESVAERERERLTGPATETIVVCVLSLTASLTRTLTFFSSQREKALHTRITKVYTVYVVLCVCEKSDLGTIIGTAEEKLFSTAAESAVSSLSLTLSLSLRYALTETFLHERPPAPVDAVMSRERSTQRESVRGAAASESCGCVGERGACTYTDTRLRAKERHCVCVCVAQPAVFNTAFCDREISVFTSINPSALRG